MAGKDWVKGFRKRHPEITLRSPEATSSARAQAFNRPNVMKFFTILQNVQQKNSFLPHRVFNVDETGLTTVQSKCSKILALKGRRQVGSLTSAERGVLSTIVVCMSAGGNFIPPMIIFPRVRMKAELQDGAPPGTIFHCHPSGWMQLDIFTEWFQHFINHAKPTAEDPVLLILDGHMTHTRNLKFIDLARKNHTTVVCLPPHCSHKLQPLDVSFMGPLNTFYVQAIEKFLRNNPGRVVSQFQVSKLFGEAYIKAATQMTAINGFRKCGIVPLDPNIFDDSDFIAAQTTEIALIDPPIAEIAAIDPPITEISISENKTSNNQEETQPCSSFTFSPVHVTPIPKASIKARSTNRKKGTAAILTSSPYKAELEASKAITPPKKRLFNKKKPLCKRQKKSKNTATNDEDSDAECPYCGGTFSQSKSNEGWVRCSKCMKWCHDGCAGCEGDSFICDFCKTLSKLY
ncbi:tigger transposable element-derived protein 6-like [Melanaphis sacchari]|uniref:tigger transposable element-derived protein 6-like n=1 Tax=Melanaphis sacchari TaxID=742174 RepID=UPI000DC1431D|nr:tigger transposable element-derived protein 6-like [Melanaphis sacchari]